MVEITEGPYSGQNKCEYTGCWYNLKCNCRSHRRDRDYYSDGGHTFTNSISDEVFHKFARSESYETLQIEPPAEYDKVRKAYRKMSLKSHPDKGGSDEYFIKVREAYDDLLLVC